MLLFAALSLLVIRGLAQQTEPGPQSGASPDMMAQQMVQLVEGKLKEMHIPGFLAKRMAKDIPALKRWAAH